MPGCFETSFAQLTGNPPLSWQTRLYDQFAGELPLPSVIDLPTGLGKTMVMAIWLIARANRPDKIPTRLIYVVDRRTVVDQASDLAKKLRDNFGKEKLAISTLRGQLADNRKWSRDPSRPAIIIGTVDLIGSALLFSGYRSSYKQKPLHAGLLGQDSLLVLDEAHLSKPFGKLLDSITHFQNAQTDRGTGVPPVKPLKVIHMSATSGQSAADNTFKLESTDDADAIIQQRFTAKKALTVRTLTEKQKLNDLLVESAIKLAADNSLRGTRIVVFVRRPEDARAIAKLIESHTVEQIDELAPKPKKTKSQPYADSVEVLTGTMRGLERDELLKKPVLKRFLDGDENPLDCPNQRPVFLISTSAGEVGFDLNADHMACDATTIDSLIQRLGRVNRRGLGDAQVQLFVEAPKIKDGKPVELKGLDLAIANTVKLLDDVTDVSPKNIATLKQSVTWTAGYKDACSPEPTTVDLTDILLDNWSMTSITAPMPGRPDVAPWLRGIDDETPQTTIGWRAELDLPGFAELDSETIEEWFDTHRVLTHETLSVPTYVAAKWFVDRWNLLEDDIKQSINDKLVIVDRAGFDTINFKELIDQLSRKGGDPTARIRNADLILPASFGGIDRGKGMLDPSAPESPKSHNDKPIEELQKIRSQLLIASDVADIAPGRTRLRQIITTNADGKTDTKAVCDGTKPSKPLIYRVELKSDDDRILRLVSFIPPREKPEFGSGDPETLASHVGKVSKAVDSIVGRLLIPDDVKRSAQLAARYHDHGKNRDRWQRLVAGTATPADQDWLDTTLGKSGVEMKRDPRGYRHEFGSLREFTDAFNARKLLDDQNKPISKSVFDLAMHLIATHHGRGRPHFAKGAFDPDDESQSEAIHTESIRRFARLQKKYGHWHLAWLENLLRCADAIASSQSGSSKDEDEPDGGQS